MRAEPLVQKSGFSRNTSVMVLESSKSPSAAQSMSPSPATQPFAARVTGFSRARSELPAATRTLDMAASAIASRRARPSIIAQVAFRERSLSPQPEPHPDSVDATPIPQPEPSDGAIALPGQVADILASFDTQRQSSATDALPTPVSHDDSPAKDDSRPSSKRPSAILSDAEAREDSATG